MIHKFYWLAIFSVGLLNLAACSSLPKCSDPQVQGLVMSIIQDQFEGQYGKEATKGITLSVQGIRDRGVKDDRVQQCAAQLVSDAQGSTAADFTYEVEKTEDGDIYATVYGL